MTMEPEGELMRAKLMKFRVSILPFFLKKVVLRKMAIEGWSLNFRRKSNGTMAFVEMYERIIKRKHIISVSDISLLRGRLFIEDKAGGRDLSIRADLNNGEARLSGSGLAFQADLGLSDGTNLYTRGKAVKKNGLVALTGQAMIEGLTMDTLSSYVKTRALKGSLSGDLTYSIDKDLIRLSGPVNYKDLTLNAASISKTPLHSPSGKAIIKLTIADDNLDMKIREAEFALRGSFLSGSLNISGNPAEYENMGLTLKMQATPIALKDVKSLVLDRALTHDLSWINNFTPTGGAISVEGLDLKGKIKEILDGSAFSRPEAMRLEARFIGLGLRHPIVGEEISALDGKVTLTDNSINLYDISSRLGSGFVEKLSYSMNDLHSTKKTPTYDLSILGHMDAGRAIAMTIRCFRDSGKAAKAQLRRISATGDTRIKFKLKGRIDVKDSAWFSTNLGLKGATFRYRDLPLSFSSVDGNIDIDSRRFTFTDVTLKDSANSTFKIEGYVRDYSGGNPYSNLKVRGSIFDGTLASLTRKTALEGLVIDETLSFASTMRGFKKTLKIEAEADLGATGLEYQNIIKKPQGIPLAMKANLELQDKTVKIVKASLSTEGTTLGLKGDFNSAKGSYSLFVNSKEARLYDLANITPLIIRAPDTAGTLKIILQTSKKSGVKSSQYKGLISLKKGAFTTSLLKERVKALDVTLRLEGDTANLQVEDFKFGGSDLYGSLNLKSISKEDITFNVISNRLDTEDIWGNGEEGKKEWFEDIRTLAVTHKARINKTRLSGSGKISISEGRILGEDILNFKAEALFRPKTISLDPIIFITEGGTIEGKAVFYKGHKSPHVFEATASLTGIHIKDALSHLGAKKDLLTGTIYGNIELRCRRGATPFARCLNGSGSLKAEHGRMWKFPVISKIFSIINIISIDELFKKGLPYKSLSGDVKIREGIYTTDNLLFESDSMKMSAVMDIDSSKSTVDATLGVHPFVTIDKVVTSIPLVGWIIGGKEKSSVSLYYTIKGPLKKPVVAPAIIRNIQKGIISKMERLITSPIKIIKESKDMIKHKDKGGKGNGK